MSKPTKPTNGSSTSDAPDTLAKALLAGHSVDNGDAPVPPIGTLLERELGSILPCRPRRPLRAFTLLLVVSLCYAAGLIYLLTVRRDAGELSSMWLGSYVVGWMVGFAMLSWMAMVPPKGQVMPRIGPAISGAMIATALFTTVGLALAQSGPSSLLSPQTIDGVARFGHGCLRWGVITALVPIGLGAVLLRGVLPVGGRAVGAAMGAAGGCLGGAMLHIHCPIADALHLGLVHGGVVLASALLGALLLPAVAQR